MSEQLGQPIVVDNRPGASGSLGTEMSARAPADGYTLLLGSVAALAINPHLLKRVGYDPVKDFAAVAAIARGPQMLVVHPSLPAATVQEFLALARKKPNALLCGSGGVGTPAHFGCELLRLRGMFCLEKAPPGARSGLIFQLHHCGSARWAGPARSKRGGPRVRPTACARCSPTVNRLSGLLPPAASSNP